MDFDIAVVGGGPTGLMLACELGLRRVPTVVVERYPANPGEAPGQAINGTVVELLEQRGLMDRLRPFGGEFRRAHFAQLWLDPTRLPERHEYSFAVAQSHLEQVLEARAVELGVTVLRGHELVGFESGASDVRLTVRSAAGEQSLRAGYLVGCDGRNSLVRDLAGIAFTGTDLPFHGLVGDVATESAPALNAHWGAHEYPDGMLTVRPMGPDRLRLVTAEFDRQADDPTAPVTADELRASIRRLCGIDPDGTRLVWMSRWDGSTRLAERYQAGRVLLAGDAAHIHFPLGGQAMSTGIEDAVNLGWKLAAETAGWAPAGLLATYQDERLPVGARACQTTAAQLALLHPLPRVAPLRELVGELIQLPEVNDYFVRMAYALDVRYEMPVDAGRGVAPGHPLLGTRLPDIPLKTPDGETSVARLLHGGRGLLLELATTAVLDPLPAAWASLVDLVNAQPSDEIPARLVLVRPDGRVAAAVGAGAVPGGAGRAGPDGDRGPLTAALARWFGHPTG